MSETETENRSIISGLESTLNFFDNYDDPEGGNIIADARLSINRAIAALRSQSEAERKIEKIRERCKLVMSVDKPFNSSYIQCNKILKILEGKAEWST